MLVGSVPHQEIVEADQDLVIESSQKRRALSMS